jgi:hypothetical protein
MSASELQRAEWLNPRFWDRLDRLESHHRRLQNEYNEARRDLDQLAPGEAKELQRAWRHYCEVIAELERVAGEFQDLTRRAD